MCLHDMRPERWKAPENQRTNGCPLGWSFVLAAFGLLVVAASQTL
jgi:hypothetical protein